MPDLRRKLAEVDSLPPPDLWEEALRRSTRDEGGAEQAMAPQPSERWRRLATIAVSLVLFAGVATFAVRSLLPLRSDRPTERPPTPAQPSEPLRPLDDPWADLKPGVNELPAPPATRIGPALVWTGREIVVWGGAIRDGATLFDDGFAFDAEGRAWEPLPSGPLSARYFPAAVWTGREVLIWGGWDGGDGYFADGAAYDPAGGVWRSLPPSPLDARQPRGAVWTGTEMIVWGSGPPMLDRRDVTGAAYDPATNEWRRIADAPYPVNWGSVVWTGKEMVVVGASVRELNQPDTNTAVAATYDPASDRWRELPPLDLDPNGSFAVWTGEFLIAVDHNYEVRAYEPARDRWEQLPSIPLDDGNDWPQLAAASGRVLVDTVLGFVSFQPVRESWTPVDVPQPYRSFDLLTVGDAVALLDSGQSGRPPDSFLIWKP